VPPRSTERPAVRLLQQADALADRLYTHRLNPLYQSGTIVVLLYLVLLVTGLWLILFYRVGAPWESVARLTGDAWTGNWVRGVHRYASDAAVVATAVHAFRMFAQRRSWGPRALAWVSGCLLLLLTFVCGWTGYVMVWDSFGLHLAQAGAKMVDALPVLSEPTSRAFTGEQPVPMAFFFLNLFAHIGIPLALGAVFWLHVKRLARPSVLPPRPLLWSVTGCLAVAAIVRPLVMAPKANPFLLPEEIPVDLFFAFWIPVADSIGGRAALLATLVFGAALLAVPWLTARRDAGVLPSSVDEQLCVGCNQCALDCPYGAITMVPRRDGRSTLVAHVNPALCVSCGICAGSCPPMGVGPPERTGRDQLARVREFAAEPSRRAGEIVAVCCDHSAGVFAPALAAAGAAPFPIGCAGNLHTSAIELLLRSGAGGVLVLTCPPRDCWHREGVKWLVERAYHGREAELQSRVTRERVRVEPVNSRDRSHALAVAQSFAAAVAALHRPAVEDRAGEPGEPGEPGENEEDAECALAAAAPRQEIGDGAGR
jgi:ferredoxin